METRVSLKVTSTDQEVAYQKVKNLFECIEKYSVIIFEEQLFDAEAAYSKNVLKVLMQFCEENTSFLCDIERLNIEKNELTVIFVTGLDGIKGCQQLKQTLAYLGLKSFNLNRRTL